MIILDNDDKLKTTEQIDKLIRAEMPNKVTHPRLHAIVARHMIHGPCGMFNKNAGCMEENKCKKNYPKEFVQETGTGLNGYPEYKRSNNTTFNIGKIYCYISINNYGIGDNFIILLTKTTLSSATTKRNTMFLI